MRADGGPAYPVEVSSGDDGSIHGRQTGNCSGMHTGMTLRDWFAGMALQALISKSAFIDREGKHGQQQTQVDIDQFRLDMAESAYDYADAMLVDRRSNRPATYV